MNAEQMTTRLKVAFPDGEIEVIDLTGTQDHWQVMIVSQAFSGLSRIESQRHVMRVFDAELKTGEVHALTIKAVGKKLSAQNEK